MSPLGANVDRILITPDWISFGYVLATQNLTSWEGHLGAYERFGAKVVSYGPYVVTLLFTHGANGAYSAYGAQMNVYANGVVETWVSMNYSSEVVDTFALSRRYEWNTVRTGYYMGPGGEIVTIPYGEEVTTLSHGLGRGTVQAATHSQLYSVPDLTRRGSRLMTAMRISLRSQRRPSPQVKRSCIIWST
jgi:hypothetical protein